MKFVITLIMTTLISAIASAKIVSTAVDYKQGGDNLQGWIVYDDAISGPRPGVVVFPEWWGLTDYPKHRAAQLASLGYIAFAADMYGKGVTTTDPAEATKLSTKIYSDNKLMRDRAQSALDQLKKDPHADPNRIAAIGYCFGGACALELARSGAPLAAIVSFHGNLATKTPDDAKKIKGKVLICTGADDSFVPATQIADFEDEMRKAGVDWQLISYGGAHHAFTNPDADSFKIPNIAYNAAADKRSWQAMKSFFEEVFGPTGK